jgi:hypothetical protein
MLFNFSVIVESFLKIYCCNFYVCFRSLNFFHVRREINRVAHYLAKYDLYNPNYTWIGKNTSL